MEGEEREEVVRDVGGEVGGGEVGGGQLALAGNGG